MKTQRLSSILFWSIISAAFIGPGTVATAASAGASFQLQLLWALTFSTIATIFLQEAAARLSIVSGRSLGEAVVHKFGKNAPAIRWLLAGAVICGCAAYQAGNILGAVAGLSLIEDVDSHFIAIVITIFAGLLIWFNKPRVIAKFMGLFVALMGVAFFYVVFKGSTSPIDIVNNAILPQFPDGSALLIVGLVGTTIVPYNLFLGSAIGSSETIQKMRFGLVVAVLIGGLISMAILVASIGITDEFTFQALKASIIQRSGSFTAGFVAIGLFAAGFTSSITAPFAAAITAQGVFGTSNSSGIVEKRFRFVAMGVLAFGLIFGLSDIRPIPIIILAQAANGVLLPFIAVFLLIMVNDNDQMGDRRNGFLANAITIMIVGITFFLGLNNILNAFQSTANILLSANGKLLISGAASILGVIWLTFFIAKARSSIH